MLTILYIDDDLEDIEIFQEAVKTVDPSIQYVSANSAQRALEILKTSDKLPDHIVLDINMPGMDGKLCLQTIRNDNKFDPINIVVYSTNSFPKDIEQMESLGATFIRKANSFNELCAIVRKLVAGTIGKRG